jgi:hypothetical protein
MAWVDDTPSGCPSILFVRRNKQLRYFHLACVDLQEGRWPALFEALRIECDSLQIVEILDPSESTCMVLIGKETSIHICMLGDMRTRLITAQHCVSVEDQVHNRGFFSRYELYPDDSEYETAEE